jgi:ferredoxin
VLDSLGDGLLHGGQGNVPALMRVWIDQDLCTGDGLCVDHCHDVFTLLEDGIAYVVQAERALNDPGGSGSLAVVEPRYEQNVVDAALACPGECIFIEMEVARPRR